MTFKEWCDTPTGRCWGVLQKLDAAEDAWLAATQEEREKRLAEVARLKRRIQYLEGVAADWEYRARTGISHIKTG